MFRFFLLLSICLPTAADPVKVTTIRDGDLDECSGIAASYLNTGCLWMHNDSGDKPDFFLVSLEDGRTRAVVRLKGAKNYDWEDMCSFIIDGKPWLMVGDVGDNARRRGKGKADPCRLYLLKEPEIKRSDDEEKLEHPVHAKIEFSYEDGRFDCEGVAVDPERREILLLTKSLSGQCGLYSIPLDLNSGRQSKTARRIASPFIPLVTALDVSPDSRLLFVGTMFNGILVPRSGNESWADAFKRAGTMIAMPPRRQGESACFDRRRNWIYVNSEFKEQPLWRVNIPVAKAPVENKP